MSRSKTPTIEEIEDEGDPLRKNIPPKNPQHILEPSEQVIEPSGNSSQEPSVIDIDDDEDTYPTQAKKNRRRFRAKPTVVQSSNDSNDGSDLDQENQSNRDSDIEQNLKPEEDSEEELGKYLKLQKKKKYLPIYSEERMVYSEERMAKDWTSPIYGFFQARPVIEVVAGRRCHEFQCAAPLCKGKGAQARIVRRYLDKADRNSTSNMHKHAKNCWGEEIVSQALETKGSLTIDEVRKSLAGAKVQNGSIVAAFERKGKGVVTFSTRQHTYEETRLINKVIDSFYLKITVCRVECV